jgi:hypothetical protein
MNDDCWNCAGCRISLAEYCATGAPPRLCGLCRLLCAEDLARYLEVWQPQRAAAPKAAGKAEEAA